MLHTRERTKCFDSYIESTDLLLRHPEVVRLLGAFTAHLLEINNSAFMPNIRWGRTSVPRHYQDDTAAVAIMPIFEHETTHVPLIIEPLLADKGNTQQFENEIALPTSGFALPVENVIAHYMRRQYAPPETQLPMSRDVVATTRSQANSIFASGPNCRITSFVSRPVEVVHMDKIGTSQVEQAAVIAHEHAHALDMLGSVALQSLSIGAAASELVGYHVTDSIFATEDRASLSGMRQAARRVEALRATYVDPTEPFAPTPDLIVALDQEGFIH